MPNGNSIIYSGETSLHSKIQPANEQYELLQEAWHSLADFLIEDVKNHTGLRLLTWIQGSYKLRTLLRPLVKDEEYDLDLGVYFDDSEVEAYSASELRGIIQKSLKRFADKTEGVNRLETPKPRCLRLTYEQKFHIDVPVYKIDIQKDVRLLAIEPSAWEQSDPKSIYTWFKESVPEGFRGPIRRLICYLKAWSTVNFVDEPKARISSIALTVLVVDFFKENSTLFKEWDDEHRLIRFTTWLNDFLVPDFRVLNPVNDDENLCRIEESKKRITKHKLETLKKCALNAQDASTELEALIAWEQAFSYLIELPSDADEYESDGLASSNKYAIQEVSKFRPPKVRIRELQSDFRQSVIQDCGGEISNVQKGNVLRFSITNIHELPPNSHVVWTVRNKGQEALAVSDFGHFREQSTLAGEIEENVAYTGTHFMDCSIVVSGEIKFIVRTPVKVGGYLAAINSALSKIKKKKVFRGRV